MNRPQRIAAIHDLSGFGRCSLTVIIPVLSAMGIQVCPVPTAVLSTHTGGLGEVALHDLTDYLSPTLLHYQKLELNFECVYSGFLNSPEQIDHCMAFFRSYNNALLVVDPVMGDHGKIYRTITPPMQQRMHELVAVANVITPNLTEACVLLEESYQNTPLTRNEAKSKLVRLSKLGPDRVIITGVGLAAGEAMANIGYDRTRGAFWYIPCDYVPASYPGTGDLFAAVLTGALLQNDSLPMAMARATHFAQAAIKTTYGYGTDPRFGVMLEPLLGQLTSHEVCSDYQPL
ncbi:MAG: pyridoxamine kinase [Candidatus Fimivivens sp.]